jgi:RHS repeat-associated protein
MFGRTSQVNYPDGGQITNCFTDTGGSTCTQSGPPFHLVSTRLASPSPTVTTTKLYDCPSGNAYKFEGKERDTETGNDDFGARYYTSRFGRWLSADWSSTPVPVPYANLTNPQTLNLYAMVADDPESFADLDGHCCDWTSGWDAVKDEASFLGQEVIGIAKTAVNVIPATYNVAATVLNAESEGSSLGSTNLPLAPTLPLTSLGQVVGADVATLGLVATGLTKSGPAGADVQANRAAGMDFESQTLKSEGLTKNTKPIDAVDPKTGETGTTIPDAIRPNGQTVEMKNVKNLSDSPQLRRQ